MSVAAHAGFGLAIWRGRVAPEKARPPTRITAHVRDVTPPPKAPEAPKTPAPVPTPPKVARLVPRARSLAPRAPEPVAAPSPPAPVKVVGLSLDATSESGNGPAFATGDTLAGATAETAAVPHLAKAEVPLVSAVGPNRVARGVPRAGSVFTPPRRLEEVKPHYPDAERAAGHEADVLLVVSLDEKGRVVKVTLGTSSGVPSFDEAARQAALKERFSPALRDGVPVSTTISFTTHFRLDTP
jgi:TonB family protein